MREQLVKQPVLCIGGLRPATKVQEKFLLRFFPNDVVLHAELIVIHEYFFDAGRPNSVKLWPPFGSLIIPKHDPLAVKGSLQGALDSGEAHNVSFGIARS